jgi:hypothetical protein
VTWSVIFAAGVADLSIADGDATAAPAGAAPAAEAGGVDSAADAAKRVRNLQKKLRQVQCHCTTEDQCDLEDGQYFTHLWPDGLRPHVCVN